MTSPMGGGLRVTIETRPVLPSCPSCGAAVAVKDRDLVELADLPCFGQPAVLVWRKVRWQCTEGCGSFTEYAPQIAAARLRLTDRAGRWATVQLGRHGRSVSEVAADLGCGWHAVMDAVAAYGQVLVDDPGRFGDVAALGLDETLRCRLGRWRRQQWTTQIVGVSRGHLLDVVEGRTAAGPTAWLGERPVERRDHVRWAALDLSGPYRKTFDVMLPDAVQVADPFHVVRVANSSWMSATAGSRTRRWAIMRVIAVKRQSRRGVRGGRRRSSGGPPVLCLRRRLVGVGGWV